MAHQGFNLNGGAHPCLPFYERMLDCIRAEILPLKMCTDETEDYVECHQRKKQVILNYKLSQELNKNLIVALPKYDEENDRFLPQSAFNTDEIFNKGRR
ncbi:hypothetical protein IMG5_084860 [Ichthyophthirius multifiliis]|uniref:Uncharacterized protein n=1 Tax=Ichthyophthirius multifiliis TaxID=5932 RepID=G0QQV7_ICHMU|nr:hypothetical protein IMG5_084860 [Ichthyophthirius multifiliis]EGR32387.1 hypothetical protein IMG5_084860 [Ichthyophthirius multifiliis]|eukprot:XP_004035873.1 hypothetical protein IMG5_084860 [Ichthyophthirius multifiliis]